MSTINAVGARNTWTEAVGGSGARASARADKMFAQVDSDADGSVDSTELQSMLDRVSQKTGEPPGAAGDALSMLDSDGTGTLSENELSAGMKDLMPPPSSTIDFAQRNASGLQGPAPAMYDGPVASAGATTGSGTEASNPLDINGDGVVSADEAATGALQDLVAAVDSNGDHQLSKSEFATFEKNLQAAVAGDTSSVAAASDPSSSESSAGADSEAKAFSAMIDLVLKQYTQNEAASAQASDSTLSLSA
jgi:hypothetical protein